MDLNLRGRRALITGASEGIGRAVAEALAEESVDLVLSARNETRLTELAGQLAASHGIQAAVHAADLSDSGAQAALVEAAGDIDILVNNAGAIPGGTITAVDEATWRAAWDLKVFGYINLMRAIYPNMVTRGNGVIINIIGQAGEEAMPDYLAGSSGNAALISLNNSLGLASFIHGVRVVAVNPAATQTERLVNIWKSRAEISGKAAPSGNSATPTAGRPITASTHLAGRPIQRKSPTLSSLSPPTVLPMSAVPASRWGQPRITRATDNARALSHP